MKKKIKLVVSDLHLGCGPFFEGGRKNPFEEFNYDEKFVEFIEYYSRGQFEDYDVELILNGDIFNFLQVDYRSHYLTVITEDITLEKMKYIIKGHKIFFEALKKFSHKEGNVITFIVGNHDQGMLWSKVRDYLDEILETTVRYKNIVYFFDGFHIEHGHMHEAANRVDPKKFFLKKNLPEPILNLPLGSHFFIDFVLKVKEKHPHVDKIRPFSRLVRWGLFNETLFTLRGFFSLFYYFISSLFNPSRRRSWSITSLVQGFFESALFVDDLSEAARRILADERVHTVIFGHTHVYQYRQFKDGKEYFNTGTWTDITSLDIASLGRATRLTYVLIEYPQSTENIQPRGHLKQWIGYHRIEEDIVVS